MNVEARITKEWLKRMALMVLFVAGGAGWFFYDGFIGYPKAAERHQAFQDLADGMIERGEASSEMDDSVRLAWSDIAKENGWKPEKPKNVTPEKIREQKVIGVGLSVLALGILGWVVVSVNQRITSDGKTIRSAFGREVAYDEIVDLDKRKWDKKGIAYAVYEAGGRRGKIVLDDYKFAGTEEIVNEIERRLGREPAVEEAGDASGADGDGADPRTG